MISFIPVTTKDHPRGTCFTLEKPIKTNNQVWCDNYEWLVGQTIRADGLLYIVRVLQKPKPGSTTIEVICERDKSTPNTK